MKFEFTLNPALQKETDKQIRKLLDAGDERSKQKALEIQKNLSQATEDINETTCQKNLSTENGTNSFFNILEDRYRDGDDLNITQIILNMTKEYSMWFSQAHETLYFCKNHE